MPVTLAAVDPDRQADIAALDCTLTTVERVLDVEGLRSRIEKLEHEASDPHLWDDQTRAQRVTSELSHTQGELRRVEELRRRLDDLPVLYELASAEQQDRFLAGVAKGGVLTAALNEPGAALPDRPATSFVGGRLSGTKVGVGYAEQADWMLVTADNAVVVVSPTADGVRMVRTPTSNGSDEYVMTMDGVAVADCDILADVAAHRVNQLALAVMGAYADGLVAGALRLTADYVANRKQFGKPLSTFQTVAAQLAEVYIASRTIDLVAKSVIWRLAEDLDAGDDLGVLGYWVTSQAPPAMQICHHLHGGMGMDVTYPMHRYYSTIKDLTRLLGGPSHRLELLGARCSLT